MSLKSQVPTATATSIPTPPSTPEHKVSGKQSERPLTFRLTGWIGVTDFYVVTTKHDIDNDCLPLQQGTLTLHAPTAAAPKLSSNYMRQLALIEKTCEVAFSNGIITMTHDFFELKATSRRGRQAANITQIIDGYAMPNWQKNTCFLPLKTAIQKRMKTHFLVPLPAHGLDGRKILPRSYRVLQGKVANVSFSVYKRDGSPFGRIVDISMIAQPILPEMPRPVPRPKRLRSDSDDSDCDVVKKKKEKLSISNVKI